MAGKVGMKHYPLEFREKIVDLYLNKGVSKSVLMQEYGLNRTQIKIWAKWQREFGSPQKPNAKPRGRPKPIYETLEQENARLKMENELLKKFHELLREEHKRK
jgi:transposase-like protein